MKTSAHPSVVNIDWSILFRLRVNPIFRLLAPILINGDRLSRFRQLPDNIFVHDLSKGIPFPTGSVDVVYHSHVLEHLDRNVAHVFLGEVRRVLREGGIQRVVVPDFERYCRAYLTHIECCEEGNPSAIKEHDTFLVPLLSQSVQREASGTSEQGPIRRFIENFLLGDARQRGQTHQWMYDRFNLQAILESHGFADVQVQSYEKSRIQDWAETRLDVDEMGGEYKLESLYMEATAV